MQLVDIIQYLLTNLLAKSHRRDTYLEPTQPRLA